MRGAGGRVGLGSGAAWGGERSVRRGARTCWMYRSNASACAWTRGLCAMGSQRDLMMDWSIGLANSRNQWAVSAGVCVGRSERVRCLENAGTGARRWGRAYGERVVWERTREAKCPKAARFAPDAERSRSRKRLRGRVTWMIGMQGAIGTPQSKGALCASSNEDVGGRLIACFESGAS
jgi:hypothetical protein